MTEVVLALSLTTIAVVAILSMQPVSWKTASRADLLSRASNVLQNELETNEMLIMNADIDVTDGTTTKTVFPSGAKSRQNGDVPYTVLTTVTNNGNQSWTVTLVITWPGNATGISESIIVSRQEPFRS